MFLARKGNFFFLCASDMGVFFTMTTVLGIKEQELRIRKKNNH